MSYHISKMEMVHDLRKTIMVEDKALFKEDIHSLIVYPPDTNVVPIREGTAFLPLDLQLSKGSIPGRTMPQTPLIVTEATRSAAVSFLIHTGGACILYSVLSLFLLEETFSSHVCIYYTLLRFHHTSTR
jgi:hypothetical protein